MYASSVVRILLLYSLDDRSKVHQVQDYPVGITTR